MNSAILILLNNYVHDVATGLLLIAALWIGWSAGELPDGAGRETIDYFLRLYRRGVRFAIGSIVVIVLTGIVRTLTFMDFEWRPALGKGLVPILLMKHALIFTMLAAGAYAWSKLRTRVRRFS